MSKDNIQGFEKTAKKEVVEESNWPVSEEDLVIIRAKLELEQRMLTDIALMQIQLSEAVERAKQARRDRDQTCVDIQKKVGVPEGTNWIVDFEKKALVKRK